MTTEKMTVEEVLTAMHHYLHEGYGSALVASHELRAWRATIKSLAREVEELRKLKARLDKAPVAVVSESRTTAGHGDSMTNYVVGNDYMGVPAIAALVGQFVRLVPDPPAEGGEGGR